MDLETRAINILKKFNIIKITKKALEIKDKIKKKPVSKEIEYLNKYIKYNENLFETEIRKSIHPQLKNINKKIKEKKYKGIIIYPSAVKWEPVQRPHHILRKLGEEGYLCFFCEEDQEEFTINEKYKNVFLVNKQEKLLPLVKNTKVIILMTYFLQYLYAKHIPNKILWMDIVDKIDFMSLYNEYSKLLWNEAIDSALILTYSAENLKKYLNNREDAILLENAVNIDDFKISTKIIPDDIKHIISNDKKIIGYYGAIEEWFDFDIIKKIEKKYNVVIIGKINPELNIEKYNLKNTYFLGPKQYEELKNYAQYFNIAMIPFKISEMTNCVSPVKFFEYMALNKPVISTDIKEMKKYKSDIIKIVNKDNVLDNIEELLLLSDDNIIKECNKIVEKNTWKKRVDKVIDLF